MTARTWTVTAALALGLAGGAAAEERRPDAPRALEEALRTGKADADDVEAIVRWVLREKEETVAREVRRTLQSLDLKGTGPEGQRWDETSRAIFGLFGTVLRDAERLHRRDARSLERELTRVVDAATPALAAALRESDPVGRAIFARGLRALAEAAPDAGVREGALRALREIEPE
jgi:hypothetical protein